MSLRQLPAPARSPAASTASTAPVASTAEAAWQALCTHPADAPLLHVDHGPASFHTPADTDGLLNRSKKKNKESPPHAPALTTYEQELIARTRAFVLDADTNLTSFRWWLLIDTAETLAMQFQTDAAKQALKDVLDLAEDKEYDVAAQEVLNMLKGVCCLIPLNATGKARR